MIEERRPDTAKPECVSKDAFEYYPADMDKDMIPLCRALNSFRGVRTFYSCSGHGLGTDEFYVSMGVSNILSLKKILRCFDIYAYQRKMPDEFSCYLLETGGMFWPLKGNEVNLRISNKWVSGLPDAERKKEFARVIRLLKKELKCQNTN